MTTAAMMDSLIHGIKPWLQNRNTTSYRTAHRRYAKTSQHTAVQPWFYPNHVVFSFNESQNRTQRNKRHQQFTFHTASLFTLFFPFTLRHRTRILTGQQQNHPAPIKPRSHWTSMCISGTQSRRHNENKTIGTLRHRWRHYTENTWRHVQLEMIKSS